MDFWQSYGVGFLALVFLFIVIKAIRSRVSAPPTVTAEALAAEEAVREESARLEYDALPKCICGEVARHPAPILKRGRGAWDWLRDYFAAPPRYKRAVDVTQPAVFCSAHAHVADALMDQFIFRVRSEYSTLNAKIAADAAGFEQEALLKAVGESLTEQQKRATRKAPATIRVLPMKTGTDDVEGG